eukprot:3824641-Pyramimonas_sp.AAC.2
MVLAGPAVATTLRREGAPPEASAIRGRSSAVGRPPSRGPAERSRQNCPWRSTAQTRLGDKTDDSVR